MRLIVFIVFCTTVEHDSPPPLKERGLLCPYTPTLEWVNLKRKFSVSFCTWVNCDPGPTTEAQRNRDYNLCRTSPT